MIDLAAITVPLAELRDLARRGVAVLERLEAAPLRGVGPEDLLTEEEVARYIRMRRSEVRAWLSAERVPRALSPGQARIPLYRVCDVRRALEHATTQADVDAWDSLGGSDPVRRSRKKKGPATPQDPGPVSPIAFPSHRVAK